MITDAHRSAARRVAARHQLQTFEGPAKNGLPFIRLFSTSLTRRELGFTGHAGFDSNGTVRQSREPGAKLVAAELAAALAEIEAAKAAIPQTWGKLYDKWDAVDHLEERRDLCRQLATATDPDTVANLEAGIACLDAVQVAPSVVSS